MCLTLLYSPTARGRGDGLVQLPISPEHVLLVGEGGGGPELIREMP